MNLQSDGPSNREKKALNGTGSNNKKMLCKNFAGAYLKEIYIVECTLGKIQLKHAKK